LKPKKEAKISRRRPPRFELIADNVALDFVNTVDHRNTDPKELIESYNDLIRFAEDSGVLQHGLVDRLIERSYVAADRAQDVLMRAREMREAMHEVFRAILQKKPVPPAALARVNADAQSAAAHMSLVQGVGHGKTGFEWRYEDFGSFDVVMWPIARAAVDLLASDRLPYVRSCSAKTCDWLFLDTSKNHHRRWCDMKVCGNRAKVRRFYARQKKEI
jgi:predicted RNA-binding Zn ribbon-like protein